GAMKAAREMDVKLVIFPGKYLDRDLTARKEILYEYQYNTLFSYAEGKRLDAVLIMADSIGCYAEADRVRQLIQQYSEIPCVLIASKLEGYVSVNYDNYNGISEAMNYMIRDLGMEKIGMVGGPEGNTDAKERKNTFIRVLEENQMTFDEDCYIEGNLSRYSGGIFDTFIEKNPQIQGIFCVNDDTAIGLYEALRQHGRTPGKDVRIFGYDNMLASAKMEPPLASVWADPTQLGEKAMNTALRLIKGERVEDQVLSTKFIKRDSLGTIKKKDGLQSDKWLDRSSIDKYFNDIFYRGNLLELKAAYRAFMNNIIDLYELEAVTKEQKNEEKCELLRTFDTLVGCGAMEYADMENFLTHIEHMHRAFQQKGGKGYELEDVFAVIYRRTVMAVEQHLGRISESREDEQYAMKLFVRDIMQFEKGNDQSYAVLLEHLGWLDIQNASIYVFKKPLMHLEHEVLEIPDKLYLKAVRSAGVVTSVLGAQQQRLTDTIFRDSQVGQETASLVVLPLFSNEMLYGILICDMTEKLFENGEFLVNQMGAAIKMLELLKSNEQIQRQLEESLITLKENNIVLDTLSKSDALTGIMNRRGFYHSGEKLLEKNKQAGERTLVAYIDMNNLKIINDRYGHDEGDFSIKLISDLLTETAGSTGLVGRVGGDEFALIMPAPPSGEASEGEKAFVERIYKRFGQYNKGSAKVYNITVSVGTCMVEAGDVLTLKEAMTLADGKLYEEKQNRVKSVAK
ncbi:MAG: GGDEF domain-containing protein, partial [Lachnospiraceae bacterium]|nr:GGDEF domain-containing protein [Lachnospiraceae bacterium]